MNIKIENGLVIIEANSNTDFADKGTEYQEIVAPTGKLLVVIEHRGMLYMEGIAVSGKICFRKPSIERIMNATKTND